MSTVKAPAVLVSLFAQFVQGDIKGGTHAHAYRVATIRSAVEQLFKGNYSPINEAKALTEGKAKKARAYAAGFASFGVVGTDTKKIDYKGALTSAENKDVRAVIEQKTHSATAAFFVAFDAVMAEKPAPKSAPVKVESPSVNSGAADPVAELTPVADAARHDAAVLVDSAVDSMVAMLANGTLTGAQLDALGDAVRAAEGRALLAAQPELLAA